MNKKDTTSDRWKKLMEIHPKSTFLYPNTRSEIINYLVYGTIAVILLINMNQTQSRLYKLEQQQSSFMEWLERAKLFDTDYVMQNRTLSGIYHPDLDTYCVWQTNTSYDIQHDIEQHEYLHFLIDEAECGGMNGSVVSCYEHFCEGRG